MDAVQNIVEAEYEEIPKGDTLVLCPLHGLQVEGTRADRRPLELAFLAASRHMFGINELLALHASYPSNFNISPIVRQSVSGLVDAFGLAASQNWFVPHAVLAVLGSLSPSDLKQLVTEGRVSLNTSEQSGEVLMALALYISLKDSETEAVNGFRMMGQVAIQKAAHKSALELTPTRLLSDPAGVMLTGNLQMRTLVKRVLKGMSTGTIIGSSPEDIKTESGKNRVIDRQFLNFDLNSLLGGLVTDQSKALEILNDKFLFYWTQEKQLRILVAIAGLRVGPFILGERGNESKVAVPLFDVPGVPHVRS